MFTTKSFSEGDMDRGLLDPWLNLFIERGRGIAVVGYVVFEGFLTVTVKTWILATYPSATPARTTIDEIPQEPSINYPEGDLPNEEL